MHAGEHVLFMTYGKMKDPNTTLVPATIYIHIRSVNLRRNCLCASVRLSIHCPGSIFEKSHYLPSLQILKGYRFEL